MSYLLDANVFIEAKNRYYDPQFCPAFWDWLNQANKEHKVFSIDKVRDELKSGNDDLALWVRDRKNHFFLPHNLEIESTVQTISEWFASRYEPHAVDSFFKSADLFLIASAQTLGYVVVTHEQPGHSKKKIKIPDVCIAMDIRYLNTFQMLAQEDACFVLKDGANQQ